jgi:hypothetical protein
MNVSEKIALTLVAISVILCGMVNLRQTKEITQLKELQVPTISEEEKYFDKLTEDIIWCESKGEMVTGDLDYPHHAYGKIQVQIRTWNWLGDKMGFTGNINSPEDQERFLRMALEKGFGDYWSCYSIVKRQNAREGI